MALGSFWCFDHNRSRIGGRVLQAQVVSDEELNLENTGPIETDKAGIIRARAGGSTIERPGERKRQVPVGIISPPFKFH